MDPLSDIVCGPRAGRMRDRRGRGARGPFALPGPLSPARVPANRTASQDFDGIVTEVLTALRPMHAGQLDLLEITVEEAPLLPEDWAEEVPLSTIVSDSVPVRFVIFRRPIAHRTSDGESLAHLVWHTMLERFGELWQIDVDILDPRPKN